MYSLPQPKIEFDHIKTAFDQWYAKEIITEAERSDLLKRLEFYENIIKEGGCSECSRLLNVWK